MRTLLLVGLGAAVTWAAAQVATIATIGRLAREPGSSGGERSMLYRPGVGWIAIALALLVSGCAASPDRRAEPATLVHVESSHSRADVRVYAVCGGMAHRLGTVSVAGALVRALPVPCTTRRLHFLLRPLAGDGVRTYAVPVRPGERVRLWIMPELEQSFVVVGAR